MGTLETIAFAAFFGTFGWWLIEAFAASLDGAFSSNQNRHLRMPFLLNYAISVGTLLFMVINGFVVSQLQPLVTWYLDIPGWILISYFITNKLYKSWWKKEENLGHVYPSWFRSGGVSKYWDRDISIAGWIHFFYMVFQIVILGLYLFSPMEKTTVLWVGILFALFLGIQNFQAVTVQGGRRGWAIRRFTWQFVGVVVITAFKYWVY